MATPRPRPKKPVAPMEHCPYTRADARAAWQQGWEAAKRYSLFGSPSNPYLSEGLGTGRARAWENGFRFGKDMAYPNLGDMPLGEPRP